MHTDILKHEKRIPWRLPFSVAFVLAVFAAFSPHAEARIVVEGDREFTDSINACLNTYRNAEGIVGDVIAELENSDNVHRVTESPDWENAADDNEKARDGSGTGSHTQVSAEELEKLKEKIDALKNKDFCTAFLHELWHAVEADRGEWTDTKQEGIWDDEIQATLFQNFIHAIRGVPPRTHYGGVDLSEYVLIGGDEETEEVEEESEEASEPETSVSMSYDHVAPGEYSEVYAAVTTSPGATVEVTLSGPGVDSEPTQSATADDEGKVQFTWRIVSYGRYEATGTADGNDFDSAIAIE